MPPDPREILLVSTTRGCVHVQFTAIIRIDDIFRHFEEIRQLAVAHHATRVLIDARAFTGKLNVMHRLQMALAAVAKFRGYQVAGVVAEAMMDPQRLGETMAVNRGAKLKIFSKLPEAEAWLEGKPVIASTAGGGAHTR